MGRALIRNAARLESSNAPYDYEIVAQLLEWGAEELRRTKENVFELPKFTIRVEDDRGGIYGLGFNVVVSRGANYEKRLKEIK